MASRNRALLEAIDDLSMTCARVHAAAQSYPNVSKSEAALLGRITRRLTDALRELYVISEQPERAAQTFPWEP